MAWEVNALSAYEQGWNDALLGRQYSPPSGYVDDYRRGFMDGLAGYQW
jgi:hypothetical protein